MSYTPLALICSKLATKKRKILIIVILLSFPLLFHLLKNVGFTRRSHRPKPTSKASTDVKLCKLDFQVVERNASFIYSAYIDDRPARDVIRSMESLGTVPVRLFVYYRRNINARRRWKCEFRYEKQNVTSISPIVAVTDLNIYSTVGFLVAMVICHLPNDVPGYIPDAVSLVTYNRPNRFSTAASSKNYVCITDLRNSTSSLSNHYHYNPNNLASNEENDIPIPGTSISSSSSLYASTFTVCTSPIHGSYYSSDDIVNFIEISRIFGAEKFIFYVDDDVSDSIRDCLLFYESQGIVEIYAFTPPVLTDLHYHGQIVSISDCIYRTMYRTKYLINQDLDELIVPVKTDSWQELLDHVHDVHSENGRNIADRVAAYSFQNQFFPLDTADNPVFSSDPLVRDHKIYALLKTLKENYVFPHQTRSKIMARPERILIWHVHEILRENIIRPGDIVYKMSKEDALLHHYRTDEVKRRLVNETRMHRYASLIRDRVQSVINSLNIS